MDIVFLGSSSGTPTKQRNVTGLALTVENTSGWYLIDCGEATQHQLLHTSMSVSGLNAIFITHIHGDHCYGLPGLLGSAGMAGRKNPLQIIAPAGIESWIKATLQMTEMYLPFELQFISVESLSAWTDNDVRVEATLLSHRVPSYAYSFTEARQEPSLNTEKLASEGIPPGPIWGRLKAGQDILHEGRRLLSSDYVYYPNKPRKIVVGGDNDRPELLREQCSQAQLLVHEATYTKEIADKVGTSVMHSSAESVASFAESVKLPNLLLTHFSPRYQADVSRSPSIRDIQMEAAENYHGKLFLAEDFARFRLSKTGELSRVS